MPSEQLRFFFWGLLFDAWIVGLFELWFRLDFQ
jgi:hypothetical protein